jgi:hypothetical protein
LTIIGKIIEKIRQTKTKINLKHKIMEKKNLQNSELRFMTPIEFMEKGDKLFVPREDFVFIKSGNSRKEMEVSIYMRKNAAGILNEQLNYFLLEKISEEPIFALSFPEYLYYNFGDIASLKEDEWSFLMKIKRFILADKDPLDEDSFESDFFENFVQDIEKYIEGPSFFIDKEYVDKKLRLVPNFLIEYLDHFQNKEDIPAYIEEWRFKKKNIDETMLKTTVNGDRKDYMFKLYDLVISVINREIEKINKEKEEKQRKINEEKEEEQRKLKEEKYKNLIYLNISELEKELEIAVSSEDYERASKIRDLISQKDEVEKNKTGWLYHPVFLFILTLISKYL